jgi:hypothetical protein
MLLKAACMFGSFSMRGQLFEQPEQILPTSPDAKFQWTSRLLGNSGMEAPTVGSRAWMGEVAPEGSSAPAMGTQWLWEILARIVRLSFVS